MICINVHRHGAAIARTFGVGRFSPETMVVIARAELKLLPGVETPQEVLYGGMIYEGYTGNSVRVHLAGFRPNWANRELLWIAFDYPFRKLNCIKLLGFVPSTNAKMLALAEHLGFTLEAKIADAVPGGDLLVLSMERKDWRWREMPRNMRRPVLGRAIDVAYATPAVLH